MWNKRYAGNKAGSMQTRYSQVGIFNKTYFIHRIVYLWHKGYMPKEIDHINGNRLDNRIENLRAASTVTNKWNSKIHKDNTTGYKCVFARRDKFEAMISKNSKRYYIGTFKTKEDAARAVSRARKELHGKYARDC